MDPLSGVLSLLKPRNTMCGGFDGGGEWSLLFPEHKGIKCYAVVSGQCWLAVDGLAEPVRLEAGDCFLLPLGRSFRLATDLTLPPADFRTMIAAPLNGRIARWNGGGGASASGGSSPWMESTSTSCWGCSRRSSTSNKKRIGWRCFGRSSG